MRRGHAARALLLVAVALVALGATGAATAPADELPRKAGHLGVRIAAVPDDARARLGLRPGEGVLVDEVVRETAAARAGLRTGDVVVALDGRAIGAVPEFLEAVPRLRAGQRVELGVLREGRRESLALVLGERPRDRGASFDVRYEHVRSNGARIRTIVTRPHAPGPHPALVLIQGLGPSSIDEPLAGARPYSRILHTFAEAGYVTVRVEKPGIGDSEGGPYADMDLSSELDVYRQALIATASAGFVDRDNVFILGHSIGGVFAPLLASEIPVRGIAVYGTVVKRWNDYVIENTRRQSALAGSTRTSIDATVHALGVILQDLLVDRKTVTDVARLRPEHRPVLERLLPDGRLYGRSLRFWSELQRTDLAAVWTKVPGDVLVMWGRHDFIATEADHPRIAAIVDGARPGKATYLAIDGADHGFRRTASVEDSFRRWNVPGGETNPEVITALKTWTEKVRHGK